MKTTFFASAFATECDRSPVEAAANPAVETWMYRSEAFAEDLAGLVPAVAQRAAAAPGRQAQPRRSALWPAVRSGQWFTRIQGAR